MSKLVLFHVREYRFYSREYRFYRSSISTFKGSEWPLDLVLLKRKQ